MGWMGVREPAHTGVAGDAIGAVGEAKLRGGIVEQFSGGWVAGPAHRPGSWEPLCGGRSNRVVMGRVRRILRGMRLNLLLAVMLVLPCQAGRETIADGRFSLEFPAAWKKPADAGEVLIARENPEGTALFVVTQIPVAADAKVDLDATAKSLAAACAKGLALKEPAKIDSGEVDGLRARFIVVATPKPAAAQPAAPQPAEPQPAARPAAEPAGEAHFLVVIDAKTAVILLQTTLATPTAKKTSDACLAIVKSFKREP